MMRRALHGRWLLAPLVGALLGGCAVGQRPGQGQVHHLAEPNTGGQYFLYLPVDYDQAVAADQHLPLVMTFHGMKPFDTANSQIREWQQEADRYGYVVCAPVLLTPDISSPLPLDRITGSLKTDEQRILAIMDDLARITNIDPNRVLTTSWSYGGYISHYMLNRHPERFSCLAVKQSNFSEQILDPDAIPRYRDRPIGVFYTENDFKLCRTESQAAARWYHQNGFDVRFAVFEDLGHERTPSLAASFFADSCDVAPKTPPVELARLKAKEIPPGETFALASAQPKPTAPPRKIPPIRPSAKPAPQQQRPAAARGEKVVAQAGPPAAARSVYDQKPQPRQTEPRRQPAPSSTQAPPPVTSRPPPQTVALQTRPVTPSKPQARPTPAPKQPARRPNPTTPVDPTNPVRVRVSSTIGISPLLVSYSAALPADLKRGAFFLWTDNGEPISNGISGQRFLSQPGPHRLEVLVTTGDGREYRAGQSVTVLERIRRGSTGR